MSAKNKSKKSFIKQKEQNPKIRNPGFFSVVIKSHINLSAFILIALLAFIAYSNTFNAEMQFDDTLNIVVRSQVNDLSNFTSLSDWTNFNKRPLAFFSFALNYYFDGYNVEGYHIVNLIIHIFSSFILFLLARFIFSRTFPKEEKLKGHLAALFAALIFATHPIQTQGVAYIIQRMTSLSAMFYLLAVLSYTYGRIYHIQKRLKKAILYYLLVIIAFWLSMISKQIAATLPFALLLFEFFFIRNNNGKRYGRYLIVSILVLLLGSITILLFGYLPRETEEISRHDYLITQFRVTAKYFQLLVLPIQQNVDYSFDISNSIWGWKELLSLTFILGLLSLAIVSHKKRPIFSFGIIWIFLTLSVESSIIPIRDVIFEHRLYLPMFGFALIITELAYSFIGRKKLSTATYLLGFIVIVLTISTYNRNKVWQTQKGLWLDISKKSPNKPRPAYNLAKILLDEKKYIEAIEYANKTLKLDSKHGEAYYILAVCNERMGNTEKAIQLYKYAIKYDKESIRSMNNLGNIFIIQKKFQEAVNYLLMGNELKKGKAPILQNLVVAYYGLKDYNNSIKYAKKFLKFEPNDAAIKADLGLFYLHLEKYETAIEILKESLEINPKQFNAYSNLALCYYHQEDFEQSVHYYSKALKLEPNNTKIKQYISSARSKMNKVKQ